jgi:acyl carrier protein phosphodiesterase
VNFLLHRHFAALELGSEAAGIGAMLPDLWRMADRRVRPLAGGSAGASPLRSRWSLPRESGLAFSEGGLEDVLAGIRHHVAIDHWFHEIPELIEGERLCADLLRASAPASLRPGLFAHITWEMALDGALVVREGTEPLRRALERGFAETARARQIAVEAHHFDRIARSNDERTAFDHRMDRIVAELVRGAWIDSYRTGAGLAMCLSGVRSRLGLAPLEEGDRDRLALGLDEVAREASRALGSLFVRRAEIAAGLGPVMS